MKSVVGTRTLLVMFIMLALQACDSPKSAAVDPVQRVSTVQVYAEDQAEQYRLTGEIVARHVTRHSFPTSGRVVEILVDTGDRVALGDVLARIDDTAIQASVDGARAVLSAARSQRQLTQAQFRRQQSLMMQGYTTRSALESAEAAFNSAQSAVASTQARVDNAADALAKAVLIAREEGIVTSRSVEPGQIVQAGQAVLEVANSLERDALFDVPEAVFLNEFSDAPIELTFTGETDVISTATVREVSPLVDSSEGTVRVRLTVNTEGKPLPIGAAVHGTTYTRATPAFRVPWAALDSIGDQPIVWVIEPGSGNVEQRTVDVNRYESGEVIIVGGLSDGEWIVSAGRQFVKAGEALDVNMAADVAIAEGEGEGEDLDESIAPEKTDLPTSTADSPDTDPRVLSGVRPVMWISSTATAAPALKLPGTVVAREENELGFTLSGRLVSREVSVGDSVKKGDPLAVIDAAPFELALLAAEANVDDVATRYRNAAAEEARYSKLISSNSTTRADYDNVLNIRDAAEAVLAQANAALETAQDRLENTVIRADFDGVITEALLEVGELALPGATVLAVANPAVREALIDVPADQIARFATGTEIITALELAPEITARGRARLVAPSADVSTRAFRVHVALENPGDSFRLGSTVIVSVPSPVATQIRLPISAVSNENGRTRVWRYDRPSGSVSPLLVDISEVEAGIVTILGEIEPGQAIVAAGAQQLQDGQIVTLGEELRFD